MKRRLLFFVIALALIVQGAFAASDGDKPVHALPTFTVTFRANGGTLPASVPSSKSVTNGESYGELPTPARTGYAFDGWFTELDGGTRITAETTANLSANQALYAHWSGNRYDVNFDVGGGTLPASAPSSLSLTNGETYGELPTPTREGYLFQGWFAAPDGGTQIAASTVFNLADNQTLYAHWAPLSGVCGDNLTWTLDADSGVLTISGEGEMYNYWSDNRPTWFEHRNRILRVEIQEGVTSIGAIAFYYCSVLTEISIPASVTAMGYSPMGLCGSLSSIVVSDANPAYSSLDGVLYNKDKTILLRYPIGAQAETFEIPAGVTEIAGQSFIYSKLVSVTIPEGVTAITNQAFGYSGQLSSIWIPASVTRIEGWVFGGCGNLTDVWYGGTETQWKEINVSEENNAPLFSATMRYASDADTRTVAFDANGGSVSPSSLRVMNGAAYGELPAPVRDGCAFDGWFTAADGGTKITASTTVNLSDSQTLYAHWKKDAITYAVEDRDGKISPVTDISKVAPGSGLIVKVERESPPDDFKTASVFCALYDRNGVMVRVWVWDMDLSDPLNATVSGRIQIPENVALKEIRVFTLNENLVPLRAAGILD